MATAEIYAYDVKYQCSQSCFTGCYFVYSLECSGVLFQKSVDVVVKFIVAYILSADPPL